MPNILADHDDRESIEDSGPPQLRELLLGVSIRDDTKRDLLELLQHPNPKNSRRLIEEEP